METPRINRSNEDSSGGCSYGCAMLFIVAGIGWPLLQLLGGSHEPEILFIPVVIGAPSFIICHILALVSISRQPPNTSKGARALKTVWLTIGAAIVLLLATILITEAARYFKKTKANETQPSAKQAEEAKWNPCFWERASELLNFATDGGPELLQALHDLYGENSLEFEGDYNGVIRFWGLVTGWAKRLKDNDRFKEMFPRSELLLVGNRTGDGANATRIVNGTVPSYVLSAGLG